MESKKIVHIATDEKFIDSAEKVYELAFPCQNYFVILGVSGLEMLNKVSTRNSIITISRKEISQLSKKRDIKVLMDNAKIVIFHGMGSMHLDFFNYCNVKHKTLIWSVFGNEIYGLHELQKRLYGKKTFFRFILWNHFKMSLRRLLTKNARSIKKKQAFKAMNYVCVLYKEEMEFYRNLDLLSKDSQQITFTYYPTDFIIKENTSFVDGNNILLGNSASFSNNHLDAFHHLKSLNIIEEAKIITPLSYGNMEYAKKISTEGIKKLGTNFKPLLTFMPLYEYHKLLQTCSITIMYHYRQQAVGNVLNQIYLGSKVFLSKKNTLYWFLKRLYIRVFSIEDDLVAYNLKVFKPLTHSEMIDNRKKISAEINLEYIVNQLIFKLDHILN